KTCESCCHFRQHYALDDKKIFRVYCGHCTFTKVKHRKPWTKACSSYIPAQPDSDSFVSKEYLSKALLRYMLELELLPEIQEADGL
ncbi:MAG: hypothetical protein J6Q54_07890, partial [Oscillospiraceae bacterium]|nr:hypothetical protein [Oscillospiraceae bacterium]